MAQTQPGSRSTSAAGQAAPASADGRDGPRQGQGQGQGQAGGAATADQAQDLARKLLDAVPERPKLAEGVELAGQMRESAFEDPPWLLERKDEGYVQVTQLLYQVAEECTGQQTLDEIAAAVSRKSGRGVSAENVRQLIATQLLGKGLILGANGQPLVPPGAASVGRSPLAVGMKTKEIPPSVINPVTTLLKPLYWPPVLVALLAAAIVAQGWLYVVHGVGGSVAEAFYAPGFMGLVLLVIVLSAGFHELGHAAALRYGGGQVKGMGAGLYTVYPAFYTDVSDNYRLPRWARVRTDLGGFYFNLILALGMMGLYVLTGQEALLLVVTLINFEIIHQLLPFLRLDGYWTLADLTGIPDFFSQMGAFLRSVLPVKRWKGRKLPALKWWGKTVFGLYILVSVPLLAVLLVLLVQSVPRLLATAWDALGQQVGAFGQAQAAGDALGVLGAAAQVLLLALPVVGVGYTLYTLGSRAVTFVWEWSKPSATRRVIGGLGGLAVAGLVVLLWSPQLPFGLLGGRPGLAIHENSYRPIGRNERLTLGDALAGVVATRAPRADATPSPGATAEGTPGGTPTPGVAATAGAATATAQAGLPTATLAPAATATPLATPTPPAAAPTTAPAPPAPAPPVAPAPAAPVVPALPPTATATPSPTSTSTPTATPTATPVR